MRMYIQPSWTDAAEDHEMWSGGNGQYRGDPSINLSTFDKNGRARMEAFSDAAVEALKEKRKTSVPLRDRILPQGKRVSVLTDQLVELETDYKAGKMSIQEYTQLRAVLVTKRNRATVLYQKAVSVKEPTHEDDIDLYSELPQDEDEAVYVVNSRATSTVHTSTWVDDLPASNSLKLPVQKALHVVRTLVRLSHKARSYWQELKEL
jgi:hypothetical protein